MKQLRGGARLWMLGAAVLAHVGIFAGLFRGLYSIPYSGTGLFYDYGGRVLAGQLAYRDFFAEYPPLALVFFTLPRMLAHSFRWYYFWYQVEVVIADVVIVLGLYWAARRWNLSPWRVIGLYTAAVVAVGPINLQQFDIFPAAFSLFAVLRFAADDAVGAGILLALGVMTKVYPILLAPVFVLLAWQRNRRGVWMAVAAFTATCLLVLVPWLVRSPTSLRGMLTFHAERGTHLDSVYSSIAFAARSLGLAWVGVVFNFRSWNLNGPVANLLARMSTVILLVVLGAVYLVIHRADRERDFGGGGDAAFVGHAALLVLAAAMAASKVLSPQYFVWLTPFVPFVVGPNRRAIWAAVIASGLLTYWLYPVRYQSLVNEEASGVALLAARNLALILIAVLAARSLRRSPSHIEP